ncbi:peptidase S74-like protein [Methylophilales phage Venkman EXVC282S]|nr:peptidase S74-like protein [Methylophilales phage Venkman EXVC282S]
MALIVKDRVKETTTTTGTGTVTLAGASAGFQSFAAIGNGNTTYYAITSGNDYEVGLGTYTASGTTLSRTTVLESSNSGSKITLSGTSDVFCTYPAEKAVVQDSDNTGIAPQLGASNGIVLNSDTVATSFTFPTNYNGISASPITVNSGITVTVPSGQRWVIV